MISLDIRTLRSRREGPTWPGAQHLTRPLTVGRLVGPRAGRRRPNRATNKRRTLPTETVRNRSGAIKIFASVFPPAAEKSLAASRPHRISGKGQLSGVGVCVCVFFLVFPESYSYFYSTRPLFPVVTNHRRRHQPLAKLRSTKLDSIRRPGQDFCLFSFCSYPLAGASFHSSI